MPTDSSSVRFSQERTKSLPARSVCLVLIAAGHRIEKLPLSELSRPMTGHRPIAAVARPDRQRPLRPNCRSRAFGRYQSGADICVSGPGSRWAAAPGRRLPAEMGPQSCRSLNVGSSGDYCRRKRGSAASLSNRLDDLVADGMTTRRAWPVVD